MNKIKKVATQAILSAGQMALKKFGTFDRKKIELKQHKEAVTQVDLASEKIIISALRKNFPEHKILSEEAGKIKGSKDYLWVIDPIDGTTNFTMHHPLWSISLGLAYKSKIILGLVYIPILKELFIAEAGKGSYIFKVDSRGEIGAGKKIKVSTFKAGKTLNTYCHARDQKSIKKAIKYYTYQRLHETHCHQLGSAAAELAFVASGRTESIMIPGAFPWDVAAGVLLVREAGGKVSDFSGKKWNLDCREILATNGLVHQQILKIINR